jgi:hypothetical protein
MIYFTSVYVVGSRSADHERRYEMVMRAPRCSVLPDDAHESRTHVPLSDGIASSVKRRAVRHRTVTHPRWMPTVIAHAATVGNAVWGLNCSQGVRERIRTHLGK